MRSCQNKETYLQNISMHHEKEELQPQIRSKFDSEQKITHNPSRCRNVLRGSYSKSAPEEM
jgi:hypothetical protein